MSLLKRLRLKDYTGTYYFRITLTGAIGLFKARWEEVQPGSPNIVNY